MTLPLIAPGLGAGAALVFLAVVTELTATLLLAPIGTETLATRFWSNADSIAYGAAAPYAALMVAHLRAGDLPAHPRGAGGRRPHDRPHHPRVSPSRSAAVRVLARHRPPRPGRQPHRHPRPVRLRQDDAAAADRRLRSRPTPARSCSATGASSAPAARVPPERRHIGYVAQEGALFPHLTVADNIAFGLPRGAAGAAAPRRRAARLVGLDARLRPASPHELSGGQQQRVALARALAPQPRRDPARRAVLLAGRRPARGHPARGRRALARRRRHRDTGHPRPGRSAVARRPGRGHAGRAAGAGRHAGRAVPRARRSRRRHLPRRRRRAARPGPWWHRRVRPRAARRPRTSRGRPGGRTDPPRADSDRINGRRGLSALASST